LARDRRRPLLHAIILAIIAFGVFSSVFVSKTFPFQLSENVSISGLSLPSLGGPASQEAVLTSGALPDTVGRADMERALRALAQTPLAQQQVTPEAAVAAPAPTFVEPYIRYQVVSGDTASGVAAKFGITLQYLLWNNPELRDSDFLEVGYTLFVPAGNGILHYVALGETLSGIADAYGVTLESILGSQVNRISSADQVKEGQLVFVPEGIPPASRAPEVTPEPPEAPALAVAAPAPPPPAPAEEDDPPPSESSSGLIWPFSGNISSYFGDGRNHAGIDIDGYGREGAGVVAAHSGTVVFAGGDSCCGYGLYVDVRASDGLVTRYAHLARISVSLGQSVSQGQTVGIIGSTGNAQGTHLHFEVRIGGVPRNPLNYLP